MKKAFSWLEDNNISYTFHDYKKQGAQKNVIETAIQNLGWETVINRKGTTWRKLPQETQDTMNEEKALNIALENPSIIKRPLLVFKECVYTGFDDEQYKQIFSKP